MYEAQLYRRIRQPQGRQGFQQPIYMGFLVRSRQRDAQALLALRHGRRADRDRQQALRFQCAGHIQCTLGIA